MITSEKAWPKYSTICDCGKEIAIMSNKPGGDSLEVICECYEIIHLKLPESNDRYRYKSQEKTEFIRQSILKVFNEIQMRMTVRQVFYQLVTKGVVDKTEAGYSKVQTQLLKMRQEGLVPHKLVSDSSRRYYQLTSYNSLPEAVDSWLHYYRLNVWKEIDAHVEIWLEKEALTGVFQEVTFEYDVPLYVTKGFTSDSFAYNASQQIKEIGKPTYIYIFSDYDPSGVLLSDTIEKKIKSFGINPSFERVALSKQQVEEFDLPTRATKKSTHLKSFKDESTELDALHPATLKEIIRDCIYRHISAQDIEKIKMEESVNKQTLYNIMGHT